MRPPVQMYADDTVVYTYAKTKKQAAIKLTAALNKVSFNVILALLLMGLIYQSNVETSADPCTQINLRQSSRVIYETFVCRQSHRTKDHTLINVAAENNRHLNITPLKTPRFRSLAPKVYDTEKHNPAKKRK